ATVVGICETSRTFQSQPVVFTTYSRATTFAPRERKLLSFVLVKAKPGQNLNDVCARIRQATGLEALPADGDLMRGFHFVFEGFKWKTVGYFMKYTGIPINFGIAVVLGFIVGTAIAGQTFYQFTLENLRHFGALKAMGARNSMLLRMILLQAVVVGSIGYGLGVGAAACFGKLTAGSELSFRLPWQLLAISAGAITLICVAAALISIRKVIQLEPAIVFKQ
ncbi:MAG: ABC transporter permease, partial [Tepidisphaeraceae bacterium]